MAKRAAGKNAPPKQDVPQAPKPDPVVAKAVRYEQRKPAGEADTKSRDDAQPQRRHSILTLAK